MLGQSDDRDKISLTQCNLGENNGEKIYICIY